MTWILLLVVLVLVLTIHVLVLTLVLATSVLKTSLVVNVQFVQHIVAVTPPVRHLFPYFGADLGLTSPQPYTS